MASQAIRLGLPSSIASSLPRQRFAHACSSRSRKTGDEALTEVNQELSPSFPLPHGERHDTRNVVVWTSFFFREVTNESSTQIVHFGHDVEQEWFDIVIESFVIQEHLG